MAAPVNCFDSLVGLRGVCGSDNTADTVWLNDIGISKTMVEEIITSDYSSAADFIARHRQAARQKMITALSTRFKPTYKSHTLVDTRRVGVFAERYTEVTHPAGYLQGLVINLNGSGTQNSYWGLDSYIQFELKEISLQLTTPVATNVLLYDLTSGALLSTFLVPVATGNKIIAKYNANFKVKADKKPLTLFLCFADPGVTANSCFWTSGSGCNTCSGGATGYSSSMINVQSSKILSASEKIIANLESTPCAGLSFTYSVICDHDMWLCAYSSALALPLAYLTAAQIMSFAKQASRLQRLSPTTILSAEDIDKVIEEYTLDADASLKDLLPNMYPPSDGKCFKCNEVLRTVAHAI